MRWLEGLAAGVALGLCILADGIMDTLGPGGFAGAVLVTALMAGGLLAVDKLRAKR